MKAQTLSVNTLIIVALGILILVIGVMMYTKYTGNARETISSCSNLGGNCVAQSACDGLVNNLGDCGKGIVCCVNSQNG